MLVQGRPDVRGDRCRSEEDRRSRQRNALSQLRRENSKRNSRRGKQEEGSEVGDLLKESHVHRFPVRRFTLRTRAPAERTRDAEGQPRQQHGDGILSVRPGMPTAYSSERLCSPSQAFWSMAYGCAVGTEGACVRTPVTRESDDRRAPGQASGVHRSGRPRLDVEGRDASVGLAGYAVRSRPSPRRPRRTVAVVERVGDRERPLLLAARGHEDAAVHVVEPGEVGELGVLVRLERLVVDDLLRRERDAPLRADPDRVAGQAVPVDAPPRSPRAAGR